MKYAKDTRPHGASHKAAEVLVEALPWIKNITGKTVVIKYGGSAMVDERAARRRYGRYRAAQDRRRKPRHRARRRQGHH